MTLIESIKASRASVGSLVISRFLPSPHRQMVGPFIFLDGGGPADVSESPGVAEHPHAGLSTFTYLLSGRVRHADSAGHSAVIEPGDIALMTAGSGITHEEIPVSQPGEMHQFLQFWLALPDELEDAHPSFQLVRQKDVPIVGFDGVRVRVGMGKAFGVYGPAREDVETVFAMIEFDSGGSLVVPPDWTERALVVVDGDISIESTSLGLDQLHLLQIGKQATLKSKTGAKVALFGGAKFASPRVIAGSFVASNHRKISDWMAQVTSGTFPQIR